MNYGKVKKGLKAIYASGGPIKRQNLFAGMMSPEQVAASKTDAVQRPQTKSAMRAAEQVYRAETAAKKVADIYAQREGYADAADKAFKENAAMVVADAEKNNGEIRPYDGRVTDRDRTPNAGMFAASTPQENKRTMAGLLTTASLSVPYIGTAAAYIIGGKGLYDYGKAGYEWREQNPEKSGVEVLSGFKDYMKSPEGVGSILDIAPYGRYLSTFRERLANNMYRYLMPVEYSKRSVKEAGKAVAETVADMRKHGYVRGENYFPKNFVPQRDEVYRAWLGIPQRKDIPQVYRDITKDDNIPSELMKGANNKHIADKTVDWDKFYARTHAIIKSRTGIGLLGQKVNPEKYREMFNIASEPHNVQFLRNEYARKADIAKRQTYQQKKDMILGAHGGVNNYVDIDKNYNLHEYVQDAWDINPLTHWLEPWKPKTNIGANIKNKMWNIDVGKYMFPNSKATNVVFEVPQVAE